MRFDSSIVLQAKLREEVDKAKPGHSHQIRLHPFPLCPRRQPSRQCSATNFRPVLKIVPSFYKSSHTLSCSSSLLASLPPSSSKEPSTLSSTLPSSSAESSVLSYKFSSCAQNRPQFLQIVSHLVLFFIFARIPAALVVKRTIDTLLHFALVASRVVSALLQIFVLCSKSSPVSTNRLTPCPVLHLCSHPCRPRRQKNQRHSPPLCPRRQPSRQCSPTNFRPVLKIVPGLYKSSHTLSCSSSLL